jgi:hypothetical protein
LYTCSLIENCVSMHVLLQNLAPTKKPTYTVFTNYTYTIGPCNFKVGQVVFLDNAIEKFTLKTVFKNCTHVH